MISKPEDKVTGCLLDLFPNCFRDGLKKLWDLFATDNSLRGA